MRIFLIAMILVTTAAAPLYAQATEENSRSLLYKVQEKYNSIEGFKAEFKQRLKSTSTNREEFREGSMAFRKPSFIRWENTAPEQEILIVGRDMVWNYFPQEDSVYIYPLSQILDSKTVLNLLSGQARLDKEFTVMASETQDDLVMLSLMPMDPQPSLVEAKIWVEPESGLIRRVLAFDFYFNENEVTFTSFEEAKKLPMDLFLFEPPSDVEVYDNRNTKEKVPVKNLLE